MEQSTSGMMGQPAACKMDSKVLPREVGPAATVPALLRTAEDYGVDFADGLPDVGRGRLGLPGATDGRAVDCQLPSHPPFLWITLWATL